MKSKLTFLTLILTIGLLVVGTPPAMAQNSYRIAQYNTTTGEITRSGWLSGSAAENEVRYQNSLTSIPTSWVENANLPPIPFDTTRSLAVYDWISYRLPEDAFEDMRQGVIEAVLGDYGLMVDGRYITVSSVTAKK